MSASFVTLGYKMPKGLDLARHLNPSDTNVNKVRLANRAIHSGTHFWNLGYRADFPIDFYAA